jgi:hypothetical protein
MDKHRGLLRKTRVFPRPQIAPMGFENSVRRFCTMRHWQHLMLTKSLNRLGSGSRRMDLDPKKVLYLTGYPDQLYIRTWRGTLRRIQTADRPVN